MKIVFVSLALLLSAPLWAQAQDQEGLDPELQAARERLDEAARELAELQRRKGPPPGFDRHRVPMPMKLGLFFGRPREAGMEVMGVTPDGPAAEAGLEAGDLITTINGRPLGGRDVAAIRGVHREVAELAPGEYVSIDYLRDGQLYTAQLEIREPEQAYRWFGDVTQSGSGVAPAFSVYSNAVVAGRPMGTLLHDLNPGLGRYFGLETGVLVLNGGDDPDRLMPGDVITEVDGVPVARQHQMFERLGSGPLPVTVFRDGGALVMELGRDGLIGGVARRFATPVHGEAIRLIESSDGGHGAVDVIVNGELLPGGDSGELLPGGDSGELVPGGDTGEGF